MTDRRGLIAERNLALDATLSGGTWALPLGNLKTIRLISEPARVDDNTDLADSQFVAALDRAHPVTIVALMGTTLAVDARIRITFAEDDASFAEPLLTLGWEDCFPALYASSQLEFEDDNWWTGAPLSEDVAAYGANVIRVLETPVSAGAVKVELDDTNNAGDTDIGHLFIGRALPTEWTFDWGRELGFDARSIVDEMPSGAEVIESRRPRRRVRVQYSFLSEDDRFRFADIGMRNRQATPLLLVADPGRPETFFREVFLARLADLPAVTVREQGSAAALSLQEIIA